MDPYHESTYGEAIADVYDDTYGGCEEATVRLLADLARGGRALELGIGTGRVALPLAARGVEVRGIDASLIKNLRITERVSGQVRGEAINALNQVQFNNPGLSPSNASFGLISASSQLNPPRTIQLGFKVRF